MTIVAVLLGALSTQVSNYFLERQRHRHERRTRWDPKKLEAYEGYVDSVRTAIFAAVRLYEHTAGIHHSEDSERDMLAAISEAGRRRGRAFERVMLLGGDDVVEAAHKLNEATLPIDWQATGKASGTLEEWREKHRVAFSKINAFHDEARTDLGVQGNVTGEAHPERDLLLPAARREDENPRSGS